MAIPVVPTIKVLITFTKFEEIQPLDEFCTPPSSPLYSSSVGLEGTVQQPSKSWLQWLKGPHLHRSSMTSVPCCRGEDIQDPFVIPPDYAWITYESKKMRMKENNRKSKKTNIQNH